LLLRVGSTLLTYSWYCLALWMIDAEMLLLQYLQDNITNKSLDATGKYEYIKSGTFTEPSPEKQ